MERGKQGTDEGIMKKNILILGALAAAVAGGILIWGHFQNTQEEILVDYGVDPWDINSENPAGTCGFPDMPEGDQAP